MKRKLVTPENLYDNLIYALKQRRYGLVKKGNDHVMHQFLIQWKNEVMLMVVSSDEREYRSRDFVITDSMIEQTKEHNVLLINRGLDWEKDEYTYIRIEWMIKGYIIQFHWYDKTDLDYQRLVEKYWLLRMMNSSYNDYLGWKDITEMLCLTQFHSLFIYSE